MYWTILIVIYYLTIICYNDYVDAPVCADEGSQQQWVGVENNENVRVTCRVRSDPADDRVQFEWVVWPGGAATTDMHQHQQQLPPRSLATGNYVTTALSSVTQNETIAATTAGLATGELVLPTPNIGVSDESLYGDRAANIKKPIVLHTVSCRATNAVGQQQNPCLYYIIPACKCNVHVLR